jgi:hypothetical protein
MPPMKTRYGNLQTQAIAEETSVSEETSVRASDHDPTDTNTEHVVVAMQGECEMRG